MAHKFYKRSNTLERLPGNITDKVWDRLSKRHVKMSHAVWSIESDGAETMVSRKKDEPESAVELSHDELRDLLGDDLLALLLGE